jgi:hypothetical protein
MELISVRNHALDQMSGYKKPRSVLAHAHLVISAPHKTQFLLARSLALLDTTGEKKITLAIENAQVDGNLLLKTILLSVRSLVMMASSWIMMILALVNVTHLTNKKLMMVSNTVSTLVLHTNTWNGLVFACHLVVDHIAREVGMDTDSVIILKSKDQQRLLGLSLWL